MLWAIFLVFVAIGAIERAEAGSMTVKNNCAFTIWPAIYTDPNAGSSKPSQATGWEAPAGSSVTFSIPSKWTAARIWGRQECDFNDSSRNSSSTCLTGSCQGGLECTSVGVPPTTSAEFTIGIGQGDFYDINMVDGFNLPMMITNNKNCPVSSCPVDLNAACPTPLRGATAKDGSNAFCKSSCLANLDGKLANSPNCCTGTSNSPTSCSQAGVQFFDYFKGRCPNAYAFTFDDTALTSCNGGEDTEYTLTFCP